MALVLSLQSEISALEQARTEAIRAKDLTALTRLYSDDFLGITSNGRRVTKSEILAMFAARPSGGPAVTVSDVDIHGAGNVVISTGLLTAGKFAMRYLHVWEKREGGWVMVRGQSTDVRSSPR